MTALKKKPIDEASHGELMIHARDVMGLEIKDGTPAKYIIAKMKAADPNITEIFYIEAPAQLVPATPIADRNEALHAEAEAMAEAGEREIGTGYQHDPKVWLQIPKVEGPGGDRDVYVAVNGDQFIIQRDIYAPVPYRVYEALVAAKQTLYDLIPGPTTRDKPEMRPRDVLSYPFNIDAQRMPSAAEVAAYKARVSHVFNP